MEGGGWRVMCLGRIREIALAFGRGLGAVKEETSRVLEAWKL